MKKERQLINCTETFIKKDLKMCTIYMNDNISSIFLKKKYIINGKEEMFEIRFHGNFQNKLCSEQHVINNKIRKIYNCDTSISPTMKEVQNYLFNNKSR